MGYAALNSYAQPASAISVEAENVTRNAAAVLRAVEESQALFGKKAFAISEMKVLVDECSEPNWDGYDSKEIDPLVSHNTEKFLRALPDSIPMPEFAPEPDGEISLDWIVTKHRMFSLSIGKSIRLSYAWLEGTDRGHAVAHFDGYIIPERILHNILSILKV